MLYVHNFVPMLKISKSTCCLMKHISLLITVRNRKERRALQIGLSYEAVPVPGLFLSKKCLKFQTDYGCGEEGDEWVYCYYLNHTVPSLGMILFGNSRGYG
jgi:hypothetical protein